MQIPAADVLIVDDEPAVCGLIEDGLEQSGFRCATASVPRHAKALLEGEQFKVLIADVAMPECTGLELLEHCHRAAPACKVILITGVGQTEQLADAIRLGAYDYLQKPFEMEKLAESVAGAISSGSVRPELSFKAAEAIQMGNQCKRVCLQAVQALVEAVEVKDPRTRKHSEQVAHYAVALARYTGQSGKTVETIRVAALLHDVGKIGVPDTVLTKPGALAADELETIRRHPILGHQILTSISAFSKEADLVRHHHERWDGQGYPDGLSAEEIPLGARFIHIADCMDAMLTDRTRQGAHSVDGMLQELRRGAGARFAPELAAAATQWVQANPDRAILPVPAAR